MTSVLNGCSKEGTETSEPDALLQLAARAGGIVLAQQDLNLRYCRVHHPEGQTLADSILGKRDDEVIDDPAEAERVLTAKRRVLESGLAERFVPTAGLGMTNAREIFLEPLRDERGEVKGLLSVHGPLRAASETHLRNDRVNRQAGPALEQEAEGAREQTAASLERSIEDVLEQATVMIYAKDLDGRYTLASREVRKVFDTDPIGLTDNDLVPRKFADEWRANDLRAIDTLTPVEAEETDGRSTFLTVKIPLVDGRGKPYGVCGVSADITMYKRMTERVFSTQRLESLGQLATGVAHDFNNLLGVMGTVSSDLLDRAPDAQTRYDLEVIESAVNRGTELTRELLLFSRPRSGEQQVENLVGEVFAGVERLLRPAITKQIEIEFQPEDTEVSVAAEAGQLEQILMNLALNARDAMPDGGRMVIASKMARPAELEADAPRLDSSRSYICLSVYDTGVGMSPKEAARAMEPFFTTKPKGEGTGLGLASVYGIAKRHGGTVAIDSEEGGGSQVRVYLPTGAGRRGEGDVMEAPAHEMTDPMSTVLLVEDEEDRRGGVARTLSRAGYAVLPVADGEECLAVVDAADAQVDVVLVDMDLLGTSGLELTKLLSEKVPGVPILHMSGSNRAAGGQQLVEKPFSPLRLVAAIDSAVRRGAVAA